MPLTLQIHDTSVGWVDAGELRFIDHSRVAIEYELDYAVEHLNQNDLFALSVTNPVGLGPYQGEIPGYLIDLIPQGNVLKRLLGRFGILNEYQYEQILSQIPLASPGNIRIKEAWRDIEARRPSYQHHGFELHDIMATRTEFVTYMEQHGSPVGGTSGAAGGAPKFLLREDAAGRYHADGYLDDSKTKNAWLVKFPFTDSDNSKLLLKTEKHYYAVLTALGLKTHRELQWHDDILFVPRFDRIKEDSGILRYFGLESFYSAHGVNTHGIPLAHEANIELIMHHADDPTADVLEYLCRDMANQALCNIDNHGRNTSFLKGVNSIGLSPIYDVTAMKFFNSELIVPLTRWDATHQRIADQLAWVRQRAGLDIERFDAGWQRFVRMFRDLERLLHQHHVPKEIISLSQKDREHVLVQVAKL